MPTYRGLTWDHPRGRAALEAAALDARMAGVLDLRWDAHPLEGFESAPIPELAKRYDVVVLDHPHLGEALEHDSLRPLEEVFAPEELDRWGAQTVGPAQLSYLYRGQTWALPLDVATQVGALRPELVGRVPVTWAEVDVLADQVPVALSLAGPHALLTFSSLCVALGEEPARESGRYVSESIGLQALTLLRALAVRAPEGSELLNPIEMLERMSAGEQIAYCPLIYGYVNYAMGTRTTPLRFVDAPAAESGGRPGSTIGGTGLAITRRCEISPELLDHLRLLLAPETQRDFIPIMQGQPGAALAWEDDRVNRDSGDFYRNTRRTTERSWVRPRYSGYIAFQSAAAAFVREVLNGSREPRDGLSTINRLHASANATATAAFAAHAESRSA